MRVGIMCYYARTDATYAALQVARVAMELGHDVSILPRERSEVNIHPQWDRHVIRGKMSPWDWIKNDLDYVVCDQPVNGEFTAYARKQKVRSYLVCLWDDLDEPSARALGGFDQIVFPSRQAFRLVSTKLDLPNATWIPWDVGVPVTRNAYELNPERIGLIWSLEGSQTVRQEPKFMPIVEQVLNKCPNAFFTVTYDALPAAGQREMKRLVQLAEGRLEVVRDLPWDKQQFLYGRHDVTIWPSLIEGLGFVGLSSLCMGTPLLAFDHPLVGEIIRDGSNGILVPCELDYNWLGVPYVQPDYKLFGRCLIELLGDPSRIEKLRYGTAAGLVERRERFHSFWERLLEQ